MIISILYAISICQTAKTARALCVIAYEKEVKTNGITEHKHYLSAGGITFAMQVTRSGTLAAGSASVPGSTQTSSLRYFHHDQLGSIAAITDGVTGGEIERLAYDPWGKRRNINGLSDVTDSLVGRTTDRGFTEHEHLDEMGVVHMNGRIYDPLIARFMSADPQHRSAQHAAKLQPLCVCDE
jgi:RHS repeat-associated protein